MVDFLGASFGFGICFLGAKGGELGGKVARLKDSRFGPSTLQACKGT